MNAESRATVQLSGEHLAEIPEEVLTKCDKVAVLNLSHNPGIRLHGVLSRFKNVRTLVLETCALQSLPSDIADMTQLEELLLYSNDFSNGLNPAAGPLRKLKKLELSSCALKSLPDWLGDLETLEELLLYGNDFSNGLNPAVGRLRKLKKLDLQNCALKSLPEELGDLEALEELLLYKNYFSNGLNPAVGRLRKLKKLDLDKCDLKGLPDCLANLETLEELLLYSNDFSDGLNPAVGRLRKLKKLDLRSCALKSLPDCLGNLETLQELLLYSNDFSNGLNPTVGRLRKLENLDLRSCALKSLPKELGDLEALVSLDLCGNNLQEYPLCLLRMKNLEELDVSVARQRTEEEGKGNCIKHLPVELAFTRLRKLGLEGNPITEPPEEIWTQGIDAIKSFMRAVIPGGQLMCADTMNIIGDTGAGKTSIAQSLIAHSPRPTAACDRTRVMQQLRMSIDETSGQSVNINDFGGHEIYHSVMPIFLPANGLLILVLDLTNRMHVQNIEKWLLTAIAKSREIRILIAGTHADKLADIRERSTLEEHIVALSKRVLCTAVDEVSSHISHIESRPRDVNMQNKLKALYQLMSNLDSAAIRVVTLSCSVPDEGLPKLHALAVELLLPAANFPVRWCYIINAIMKLSPAGFYIQMSQVQDIAKVHFTTEDDDRALTTILRFLAKTSLIIWVEDHPRLRNVVFHSPQKIVEVCKKIFHHDSQSFPVHFRSSWEEYEHGIVREPLLRELLKLHTVGRDRCQEQTAATALPFEVAVDFLQQFNLVSCVSTKSDGERFIIPSKLPADDPPELKTFYQTSENCVNRVSIRLSFIGCIVPMSFFETYLSAMLTIAGQLFRPEVHPWKSGLIVIHGEVHFLAKLCDDSITLTAFSEPPVASPWTVLQPVLQCLNEHAKMWSGAPPSFAVECPWCFRYRQCEYSKNEVRGIEVDLQTMAQLHLESDVDPTCPECLKWIPQSLCFPPTARDSFAKEQRKIHHFFETNEGNKDYTKCSELLRRLRKATPQLVQELDGHSVDFIVDELLAAHDGHGLITDDQCQEIEAETTNNRKVRKLLRIVGTRGDEAIRTLASSLKCEGVQRPDLADLLLEPPLL